MRYDNACRLFAEWPLYMCNAGKQKPKAKATAGKDDPLPGEHAIVHHVIRLLAACAPFGHMLLRLDAALA